MRSFVAIVASVTALSCHTVLRPTTCPTSVEPSGRSAIAWQHVANKVGASGTISRVSTLDPIAGASVDLTPLTDTNIKPLSRPSDSHGEVSIESLRSSKYRLRVRAIGYYAASDTVVAVDDSGLVFRALMATNVMMLDGCGYAYIQHRVPWWIRK